MRRFENVDREEVISTINKLASDLLEIAEEAMPDTFFHTDSRCRFARRVLENLEKLK